METKRVALIVGAGSSIIGKTIASELASNFEVTTTGKINNIGNNMIQLDFSNKEEVINFVEQHEGKYFDTVFLNVGYMNRGKTIGRASIRKYNDGDPSVTLHLNNILLIERMKFAKMIDENTKVIYNATIQILSPKGGYELYAELKSIVSYILLGDDDLDVTVLALNLVEGSVMAEQYIKENPGIYNMTTGSTVQKLISYIMSHRHETKRKIVALGNTGAYNDDENVLEIDPTIL